MRYFEQRSAHCKKQFHEVDRALDEIRAEALEQERQLVTEREAVRERVRDVDFADEQMDARIDRSQKAWAKQLQEHQQKMEIVRLNQQKTSEETEKVAKELNRKNKNHQMTKEAWERELQIVMREQAVSAMIQESYVKEIARVKRQIIAANEITEASKDDIYTTGSFHHPPTTASSNHRFGAGSKKGGAPGKKASSTMRRYENSFISNHEFSKPAKSVRPTATAAQRGQQPL